MLEFISLSHLVYSNELHPETQFKWRAIKTELPPLRAVKSHQDYTLHYIHLQRKQTIPTACVSAHCPEKPTSYFSKSNRMLVITQLKLPLG